MLGRIVNIQSFTDEDGTLACIERDAPIPFDVERIFYIMDVSEGATRGNHAAANARFAFIALNGTISVCLDNGIESEDFILQKRTEALVVENLTWILARNFSENAILMVLSDKTYQECEYIYDYSEFLCLKSGSESI